MLNFQKSPGETGQKLSDIAQAQNFNFKTL